jgi:hypothetical protein
MQTTEPITATAIETTYDALMAVTVITGPCLTRTFQAQGLSRRLEEPGPPHLRSAAVKQLLL